VAAGQSLAGRFLTGAASEKLAPKPMNKTWVRMPAASPSRWPPEKIRVPHRIATPAWDMSFLTVPTPGGLGYCMNAIALLKTENSE
jgi:hypothetical protein